LRRVLLFVSVVVVLAGAVVLVLGASGATSIAVGRVGRAAGGQLDSSFRGGGKVLTGFDAKSDDWALVPCEPMR
jgi:hypothetical protein